MWKRFMARNGNIPDLLEQFMEESGMKERWVTVNELRTYFHLDETTSPAISGFLRRIYTGTFLSFPYRVERIERITLNIKPHPRIIKKYYITKRPVARMQNPIPGKNGKPGGNNYRCITDSDAIACFNRVLQKRL